MPYDRIPGFLAERALVPTTGRYRGRAAAGRSAALVPALDTLCGRCETVGAFGSIRGVGRRSCCQQVWRYDPITKRYAPSWICWFESCSAEPVANQWLSF